MSERRGGKHFPSFGIRAWNQGGILGGIIILNIFTADVEPGDIFDLSTGGWMPADARLIEALNLETDEALLTGESAPDSKQPRLTFDEDRLTVVYSSTNITKGRGRGVVFATGMFIEIGLIASTLQGGDDPRGDLFLWLVSFATICATVALGANKFDTRQDVVLYAVTTAVGTVPISLLLVLTVTLAALGGPGRRDEYLLEQDGHCVRGRVVPLAAKGRGAIAGEARGTPGQRFLFFAVTAVFLVVAPTPYIPIINHVVSMHTGISREWAVIFVAVAVFILGAESWKWTRGRTRGGTA
ncbi:Sodium p-type [Tolypocladium paradoxum]|uniref:Sodium p-type n=1 Tax=Tolypocladium paradoxum TaxID=94208 RepID=A0A2S4L7I7_9HYPO|nr:Sodium p-type [Tolypocladium paradoxum]